MLPRASSVWAKKNHLKYPERERSPTVVLRPPASRMPAAMMLPMRVMICGTARTAWPACAGFHGTTANGCNLLRGGAGKEGRCLSGFAAIAAAPMQIPSTKIQRPRARGYSLMNRKDTHTLGSSNKQLATTARRGGAPRHPCFRRACRCAPAAPWPSTGAAQSAPATSRSAHPARHKKAAGRGRC
jgi:hypothetical protein